MLSFGSRQTVTASVAFIVKAFVKIFYRNSILVWSDKYLSNFDRVKTEKYSSLTSVETNKVPVSTAVKSAWAGEDC